MASRSLLLSDARQEPSALLSPTDPKRVPRSLTLAAARALGTKRGKGRGSFVADTRAQTIDFYGQIVQSIGPWRARPPRLPLRTIDPDPPASSEPPPFTAPEARDVGEADEPTTSLTA